MARLTAKWWAANKPKKFNTSLDGALARFESAVKTGNEANIFDALGDLQGHVVFALNAAKNTFRKDPATLVSVETDLKEMLALIVRENTSLVKLGARDIKVWGRNFGAEVQDQMKQSLQGVTLKGGDMELKLDLMTIRALENSGTHARYLREVNDIFEGHAARLAASLDGLVAGGGGFALSPKAVKLIGLQMQGHIRDMDKQMLALSAKMADIAANYHAVAKDFKKKRAINLTTASLAVVGSAAALAVPGTTALAAVVLARAAGKLLEEIVILARKLEAKYNKLVAQIQKLAASYAAGARGAKEVAKTGVNALVGANVMVTYTVVVDRYEDFLGTLAVLADRVNASQDRIMAAVVKFGAVEKALDKAVADQRRFARTKASAQLALVSRELDTMLDKSADTMRRVVAAERATPRLTKALKDLGKNGTGVELAGKIIPVAVNLALAIGSFGDAIGASQSAVQASTQTVTLLSSAASELSALAS